MVGLKAPKMSFSFYFLGNSSRKVSQYNPMQFQSSSFIENVLPYLYLYAAHKMVFDELNPLLCLSLIEKVVKLTGTMKVLLRDYYPFYFLCVKRKADGWS